MRYLRSVVKNKDEDFFFKWHVHDASFEKRCHELVVFKKEFGHAMFLEVIKAFHHKEVGVTP